MRFSLFSTSRIAWIVSAFGVCESVHFVSLIRTDSRTNSFKVLSSLAASIFHAPPLRRGARNGQPHLLWSCP